MTSSFTEATRDKNLLRMAMEGLPGAGKTWTALLFAQRLAKHYGGKYAILDSEYGRSRRYVGMRPTPNDEPLSFQVCTLTDFSPANYTAKIEEAGRAGFTALVIDSFSHEWAGRGGILSIKDAQPAKKAYTGWSEVNPLHERVIDAVLGSPCHIIATLRAKVKHVLNEENKPQKIGVGTVQRPGTEYEFEIFGQLDRSHILTITKSMCPAIDNGIFPCPKGDFMDTVIQWLETGEAPAAEMTRRLASPDQLREIVGLVNVTGYGMDKLHKEILARHKVKELADLRPDEADAVLARLRQAAISRRPRPEAIQQPSAAPVLHEAANGATNGNGAANGDESKLPQRNSFSAHAITEEQLQSLAELRQALFDGPLADVQPDARKEFWQSILAKRNVNTARALTQDQAIELIANLRHKLTIHEMEKGLAESNNGSAESEVASTAKGEPAESAASGG